MQTNIDIVKNFIETPDGVLSIHQISKKLALPYGTAYNRVHALHSMGIVQILPQGKAKLCALNPDNSMTASLLALSSSQKVEQFIATRGNAGLLFKRIRQTIIDVAQGALLSAIILTPDTLDFVPDSSMMLADKAVASTTMENELLETGISLDFFYIQEADSFNESEVEHAITSLLPPGFNLQVTSMTVNRKTMLGMFAENENEVGLAAYSMLYSGMVILGHENYYSLILEAFARRLSLF